MSTVASRNYPVRMDRRFAGPYRGPQRNQQQQQQQQQQQSSGSSSSAASGSSSAGPWAVSSSHLKESMVAAQNAASKNVSKERLQGQDEDQSWDLSLSGPDYNYWYDVLSNPHTDTCTRDPFLMGQFEDGTFFKPSSDVDPVSIMLCPTPTNRKRRLGEVSGAIKWEDLPEQQQQQSRSYLEGSHQEQSTSSELPSSPLPGPSQVSKTGVLELPLQSFNYRYRIPQSPPQTSMDIFQKYVTVDENGRVDASGIIDKACYTEWAESRKKALKNPYLTFVQTIRGHITGDPKVGRNPFHPKVEASLLQLLQRKRTWPCFEGTPAKYGSRGMKLVGFHAKNHAFDVESNPVPQDHHHHHHHQGHEQQQLPPHLHSHKHPEQDLDQVSHFSLTSQLSPRLSFGQFIFPSISDSEPQESSKRPRH